ncbi:glycosyltransferase [Candidatus Gottesmanbacteria bacterium]|nr:glycosyltransferase [Candidatus Gottesmanbacteria bacterium]
METLSIVIPVYNEEERLGKTFQALKNLKLPRELILEKIIFVNDGSCDRSIANIKYQISNIKKKLNAPVKIISYKKNKGKGYAIARGMEVSNSDYTLFCDSDMSTDLNEIRKFVPSIKRNVPIIIGTRKNGRSTVIRHQTFLRESMGKVFTFISNVILNTWVTDFTCGFKAYSKEAKNTLFPMLKTDRWGFDAEVIFLGRLSGFNFVEVPVVWSDDRRSKVNLFVDIPQSLFDILKIRVAYLI